MSDESQEKLTLLSVKPPRRRYVWTLSLVAAMFTGVLYSRWLVPAGTPPGADNDFRLIAQAWNIIRKNYVDRGALQPSVMTHGAIQGLAESLGDTGHTVYLNPDMRKTAGSAMRAKFTGIGVEIQIRERQAVIVAALDGSPALKAGLRAGEILMEVDGTAVTGLSLSEIHDKITGPSGQPVKIVVQNPRNGAQREVTIVRASIKINNVSWQKLPGEDVAHLRITIFSDGVSRDLRNALLEIQQAGLKHVILDLRNNPGGVLDEAVDVASEFLPGGNVLLERAADGNITPRPVKPGGVATNMDVTVLINGGSASASEIVAGALRDAKRASLVGQRTFGTGTVLEQFPLADGSALLLAVGEWLTPSGRSFWHKGIKPDTEVTPAPNSMPLLPIAERGLSPAQLRDYGDEQLLRALALITNAPDYGKN